MVAVAVAIALQHVCLVQALIEPKSECQDGITSDALFAAGSFHTCAVRVDHLCAALAVGPTCTQNARGRKRDVCWRPRAGRAQAEVLVHAHHPMWCVWCPPSRRRMCTAAANGLHLQPCTIGCAELYASDPVMGAARQGVQK